MKLARLAGSPIAIVKDKSPSCGLGSARGENPSTLAIGVTAAVFETNGITVSETGEDHPFQKENFVHLLKKVIAKE